MQRGKKPRAEQKNKAGFEENSIGVDMNNEQVIQLTNDCLAMKDALTVDVRGWEK